MGFARLPPLRLRKKNVGSKEPTFANGFRFLTSTQPCGRLRSFPRTGRQSFDPWGLLRSPSRSPRSCQPASGLPRHSACTLFLHEGAEVGHFAHLSYGRSHTYMCGRAILQGLPCAPAARPHGSCNQASLRESCPQGVTIPNADAEKDGSIGIAPRIFEKKIVNPKPVSREDVLAAQNAYNKFMSIAKFPF